MTEPTAKIIADSISPWGDRLTTMEVTFHRFVLAEFNTHRAFSRNSASSRAIPVAKQIEKVRDNPAIPLSFPAEKSGMQGGEELAGEERQRAKDAWLEAKNNAISLARELADGNVHKSVVNRLLEPFMWHTAIVSATDWEGFWAQRCSPLAQPEIRAVAEAMQFAYSMSEPQKIGIGQWHLPYTTEEERKETSVGLLRALSVARCARVSYLTHDGEHDPEADLKLYDRLVSASPPHASPLEHVATPKTGPKETQGNFTGWNQLRHLVIS